MLVPRIPALSDRPTSVSSSPNSRRPQSDRSTLLSSSPSSKMTPWPQDAESILDSWMKVYSDAVAQMRQASIQSEVTAAKAPIIGVGTRELGEKFMSLTHRRHPVVLLPQDDGLVAICLTGDPTTVHGVIAGYLLGNLVDCIPNLDRGLAREFNSELRYASDPTWKLNIRFPFAIKNRQFSLGATVKEPDGAIWSARTARLETVVEVAFANETAKQLLWEVLAWSQQGSSTGSPIIRPRNTLGLRIESVFQFRLDRTQRAFALFLLGAADSNGNGQRTCVLFNATNEMKDAYEAIISSSPVPDTALVLNPAEWRVPFDFVVRFARQEWMADPIIFSLADLTDRLENGLTTDRDNDDDFA
ncbi:unnamed protein product [Sympodiomycopsis kandeliae]